MNDTMITTLFVLLSLPLASCVVLLATRWIVGVRTPVHFTFEAPRNNRPVPPVAIIHTL